MYNEISISCEYFNYHEMLSDIWYNLNPDSKDSEFQYVVYNLFQSILSARKCYLE